LITLSNKIEEYFAHTTQLSKNLVYFVVFLPWRLY